MHLTHTVAFVVVSLSGAFLVGLGLICALAPQQASRFFLGFAGSATLHYAELLLRLIAGAAFIQASPRMLLSSLFLVLGWLLVLTTLGLCLIPWRWHSRFAQRTVPLALRWLPLMAISSLALGGLVLTASILGAGRT